MKKTIFIFTILVATISQAKLRVVTTTSTLQSLVKEIAQERVEVLSLTTQAQDPHFVEAKPSYMVQLRQADLLVAVGLDLEIGWLENIQRGAKNPEILTGKKGFFAAGEQAELIEIGTEKMDRANGDVHPHGNPHFHLDPLNMIRVAAALANKLAELDPKNAEFFKAQALAFSDKIKIHMIDWNLRVKNSKIQNVLTYHKSLNYFLKRFGLRAMATIEPKPGIPPTAKHIIALMQLVKEKKVKCILNESYFETTAAERIKKETGAKLQVVPVEVQSHYFDLIESLVKAVEMCGQGA